MSQPPSGPAPGPPERAPEPQAPQVPDASDCCGGGCLHCVYDLYDEALQRYQEALAQWRQQYGP